MDCGPACLRMIASYHGKEYTLQDLRNRSYIDKEGVSLQGISEAAESIGYRTLGVKIPYASKPDLPSLQEAPLPVIVHWNQNHFVVVYRISKNYLWIADPGSAKHKLTIEDFKKHWINDYDRGIALLLEPTAKFADIEMGGSKNVSSSLTIISITYSLSGYHQTSFPTYKVYCCNAAYNKSFGMLLKYKVKSIWIGYEQIFIPARTFTYIIENTKSISNELS